MAAYGTVKLTLDNVLLPPEKLSPTPSSLDGLDSETEADLRIMGCDLIQISGILLKLPQTAMATGQVLFQRFYYSKSFVRQPMETNAMACVYLASKIEESPRRIIDVANVFHHIRQFRTKKIIQPLPIGPSYARLKSDVILAEVRILKELGFCVHVKHPHKLIVVYLQQLGYDKDSNFVQLSWNYMNDALRTNVFVRFAPEAIACACIYLSSRTLNIPLPVNPGWFEVFEVEEEDLREISITIMELYERQSVNVEEMENTVNELMKAYQETRLRNKAIASQRALLANDKNNASTAGTVSNATAPVPPVIPIQPLVDSITEAKTCPDVPQLPTELSKGGIDQKKDQTLLHQRGNLNGTVKDDHIKKLKEANNRSPIRYDSSHSPRRHKHKKRRKTSKYSRSSSRSRSRSPRSRSREHDRDGYRRQSKKTYRERSPSYSPKRRHQKKHYRN